MKIPFTLDAWLKDKSQKVETRDGRLVHDIWRVKEPSFTNNRKTEVCALIDGEEDALVFFEGGRYLPTAKDTDSPFDLFIITPEPELTEFEKCVKECLEYDPEVVSDGDLLEATKEYAKELLATARKELQPEKDLPRWKKCAPCDEDKATIPAWIVRFDAELAGESAVVHNGHYILFGDLEKLPKEDEK